MNAKVSLVFCTGLLLESHYRTKLQPLTENLVWVCTHKAPALTSQQCSQEKLMQLNVQNIDASILITETVEFGLLFILAGRILYTGLGHGNLSSR